MKSGAVKHLRKTRLKHAIKKHRGGFMPMASIMPLAIEAGKAAALEGVKYVGKKALKNLAKKGKETIEKEGIEGLKNVNLKDVAKDVAKDTAREVIKEKTGITLPTPSSAPTNSDEDIANRVVASGNADRFLNVARIIEQRA
jgi:hypothetical protein